MTTLDKTIPYYPVLMELTELPEKMEYHLAEGYRVIPFDARYSQDWVRLHVALGQRKACRYKLCMGRRAFWSYTNACALGRCR